MIKYCLVLFFSVIYSFFVEYITLDTPFPAGVYTGTRYRISSDEPNAKISTKIEVSQNGTVRQKITLKDDSIDSYAAFEFKGTLESCKYNGCEYFRTGDVLLKSDIHQPIFESKYLELLSKAKGKKTWHSYVEVIFKNEDVVVLFDTNNNTPYLYAVSKEFGPISE
jgi:hypothetical protein